MSLASAVAHVRYPATAVVASASYSLTLMVKFAVVPIETDGTRIQDSMDEGEGESRDISPSFGRA